MKIMNQQIEGYSKKNAKRVGRGISAGGGKTAGRGTKGQKSRAGHNIPRQFEGGQSNLSLRLPKVRGFKGIDKTTIEISLSLLDKTFKANDKVSVESLVEAGLLKPGQQVKILANGEITKKLEIVDVPVSKSALAKIANVKSAKSEKPADDKPVEAAKAESKKTVIDSSDEKTSDVKKAAPKKADKSEAK